MLLLLGAVVAGVLTTLAPCVLPMLPVIVGGFIPEADAVRLKALGVAEVFTPKDFGLNDIMSRFVDVIRVSRGLAADAAAPAHA